MPHPIRKGIRLFLFISIITLSFSPYEYPPSKLLNKKPPVFSCTTLENKKIDSLYFVGKVTYLNFFSVSCPPCLEEFAFMNQLRKRYSDTVLNVICVSMDKTDELKAYLEKKRKKTGIKNLYDFDFISECDCQNTVTKKNLTGGYCESLSTLFEIRFNPVTFLIDKQGVIRKHLPGFPMPRDKGYEDYLQHEVDSLLQK